jgi:DNA-binding transcriptional LysR family regulator
LGQRAECQPWPVALGVETFGSRRLIDALLTKSRLTLRVAMEASAVQPQKMFARDTDAICFQYQIGTVREGRDGDLVAIPLTDLDLTKGRLVLASRAGRILPIPAASFVETLKQALARLSEGGGSGQPVRRVRAK